MFTFTAGDRDANFVPYEEMVVNSYSSSRDGAAMAQRVIDGYYGPGNEFWITSREKTSDAWIVLDLGHERAVTDVDYWRPKNLGTNGVPRWDRMAVTVSVAPDKMCIRDRHIDLACVLQLESDGDGSRLTLAHRIKDHLIGFQAGLVGLPHIDERRAEVDVVQVQLDVASHHWTVAQRQTGAQRALLPPGHLRATLTLSLIHICYGFAQRSKAERDRWARLIGDFFDSERSFNLVVSLVDIRHDPSKLDFEMINFLRENGFNFIVCLTKADKLSKSQQGKHCLLYTSRCV